MKLYSSLLKKISSILLATNHEMDEINSTWKTRIRKRGDFIANYDETNNVEYETRAVAFFDILGWQKAVEDSKDNPNLRRLLLNAVWFFGVRASSYVEEETSDHHSEDEYSQFSDSLIVSFPYKRPFDLYRLLNFVTEFQGSMLLDGLPIRGGVTIGPIFHRGNISFGPALNKAYNLENKEAKFPRVIIDSSLNSMLKQLKMNLPSHRPFITKDADEEFFYTDFLTLYAMNPKLSEILDYKILYLMEKNRENSEILRKYEWLNKYWQEAKIDSAWRVEFRDKLYAEQNFKRRTP